MGQTQKSESDSKKSAFREFRTVTQLADLLQLNEMTIYRMVKTGQLPYYLIGRIIRFRADDVEDFLRQRRVLVRKRKA